METEENRKYEILVVEDDAILCDLISRNLERSGYSVAKAGTGKEALSQMMNGKNYILLLDYHLPDMTGKELIESCFIKEHNIPFIVMTGQGDERLAVEMMKLNARDYIVKDGNFLELLPTLTQQVMDQINIEKRLIKSEESRKNTEQQLQRMNDELELKVNERTTQLAKVNEELIHEISDRKDIERRLENNNIELQLFAEISSELVAHTVENANRMKNLLSELLSYSRLGIDGDYFHTTDFAAALESALLGLKQSIDENSAIITYDPLPTITADTKQIVMLFENLIENSIKFCNTELPRIHISAKQDENEWIFSVTDNGIGIETEDKDMIFTVFSNLQSGGSSPKAGIGLATCKKILECHSGRIWVESNDRKGSTFYFSIPKRQGFMIK
jgi:signal transduction histidine kinase